MTANPNHAYNLVAAVVMGRQGRTAMKHLILAAAVACAFAAAVPPRAAAQAAQNAKTKDQYVNEARAELDALAGKIDALERKAKKAGSSAREGMDRKLKELKARRRTADKSLAKLKGAGGKAWSGLEADVDKSIRDLKEAVDGAVKD
jgi:uncharacterized protein involved in copper resistance